MFYIDLLSLVVPFLLDNFTEVFFDNVVEDDDKDDKEDDKDDGDGEHKSKNAGLFGLGFMFTVFTLSTFLPLFVTILFMFEFPLSHPTDLLKMFKSLSFLDDTTFDKFIVVIFILKM